MKFANYLGLTARKNLGRKALRSGVLVALVLSLGAGLTGCPDDTPDGPPIDPGAPAPDFRTGVTVDQWIQGDSVTVHAVYEEDQLLTGSAQLSDYNQGAAVIVGPKPLQGTDSITWKPLFVRGIDLVVDLFDKSMTFEDVDANGGKSLKTYLVAVPHVFYGGASRPFLWNGLLGCWVPPVGHPFYGHYVYHVGGEWVGHGGVFAQGWYRPNLIGNGGGGIGGVLLLVGLLPIPCREDSGVNPYVEFTGVPFSTDFCVDTTAKAQALKPLAFWDVCGFRTPDRPGGGTDGYPWDILGPPDGQFTWCQSIDEDGNAVVPIVTDHGVTREWNTVGIIIPPAWITRVANINVVFQYDNGDIDTWYIEAGRTVATRPVSPRGTGNWRFEVTTTTGEVFLSDVARFGNTNRPCGQD